MHVNVDFGSIEEEAMAKAESLVSVSNEPRNELIEQCEARLAPADLRRVHDTVEFLDKLESQDPRHPSIQAYLSHPLRVALRVLRMLPEPRIESVITSLLHNVYEIGGLDEDILLSQGYGRSVTDGIRLLTIDRRLQNDAEYLRGFYGSIEAFGAELALIRCIDKLDNLLAHYAVAASPERTLYLVVSQRHVVPMARRLDERLGEYMADVVVHMAEFGSQAAWVRRLDLFERQVCRP